MAISVRPLAEGDFALVASWLMDPEINRWLYAEWRDRKIDEKLIAITSRVGKNRMWMASCDGAPYGLVTVGNICDKDHSGIVWYLRGSGVARRSGAMTQSVLQVAKEAFAKFDVHSLSASTQAGNTSSERLLTAVGFKRVGTLREAFLVNGEFIDRNLFDLLRSDLESG